MNSRFIWFCVYVLFLISVAITMAFGLYSPENLRLGPNASILIQPNTLFVESIEVFSKWLKFVLKCLVLRRFLLVPGGWSWCSQKFDVIWILWSSSPWCYGYMAGDSQDLSAFQYPQGQKHNECFYCSRIIHVYFNKIKGTVVYIFIPLFLQEWVHYLNEGSQINVSYSVSSWGFSSIGLIIAKGKV